MEIEKLDPDDIPIWLSQLWPKSELGDNFITGINDDDCAIVNFTDKKLIVTTDFLNANPIAKELNICSNWDLGRLVVAANLSDLCGTGAKPLAMMLAVVLERNTTLEEFKQLILGVKFELDKHNIPLIGGDTKLGKAMALLGIAIGTANDNKLFLKNSANPGDQIWVSGNLGSTSAAVDGLTNYSMNDKWCEWAKQALINPVLPIQKSLEASRLKIGNGGTDISDGLGADLWDLCIASGVGCVIEAASIPFDQNIVEVSIKRGLPEWAYSFVIGGDFQFVLTANIEFSPQLEALGYHRIGCIVQEHEYSILLDGDKYIKMPVWGHRDSRTTKFSDEVEFIINEIKNILSHD